MKYKTITSAILIISSITACGGDGEDIPSSSYSSSSSANSSSSNPPSSSSINSSSSSSIGTSSSSGSGSVTVDFPDTPVGYGQNTTGGSGGRQVTVTTGKEIYEALCNRTSNSEPLEILINGTITPSNTSAPSNNALDCDTESGDITITGKDEDDGIANISLIGVGANGVLDGVGITIYKKVSNVIIRNLTIKDVSGSGGDGIELNGWKETYGIENVWIDHNEIYNGSDSLIDMKKGVKNVTVSYNYLHDSGRGGLIGFTDDDDINTDITFHHNWYENIDSRTPLLRSGFVHSYNNYFDGLNKSGMNPRYGGRIKVERNYFDNTRNPLGTFYTEDIGSWEVIDNHFTDTVLWVDKNSPEYDSSDSADGPNELYPAGPNPISTAGTLGVPYSYTTTPVMQVPGVVKASAGVDKLDKKGTMVNLSW